MEMELGFQMRLPTGPVAIVAAAGTGLQEVSTLLDHCGIGVRHGLGVGGNDPKEKIGGLMMSEALKMLEECEGIDVINIVSKPPAASVQQKIIDHATKHGKKKYVMTFIGGSASIRKYKSEKSGQRQEANQAIKKNHYQLTLLPHRFLQRQNISLT